MAGLGRKNRVEVFALKRPAKLATQRRLEPTFTGALPRMAMMTKKSTADRIKKGIG